MRLPDPVLLLFLLLFFLLSCYAVELFSSVLIPRSSVDFSSRKKNEFQFRRVGHHRTFPSTTKGRRGIENEVRWLKPKKKNRRKTGVQFRDNKTITFGSIFSFDQERIRTPENQSRDRFTDKHRRDPAWKRGSHFIRNERKEKQQQQQQRRRRAIRGEKEKWRCGRFVADHTTKILHVPRNRTPAIRRISLLIGNTGRSTLGPILVWFPTAGALMDRSYGWTTPAFQSIPSRAFHY